MDDSVLSFNAANLSPEEVAENFIFPENATGFFRFKHFILLGPRGVGKTTLMKALTARGLHTLHKRGFSVNGFDPLKIDYMPVYIPADALWKGTVQYFTNVIEDEPLREHILNGIFVYHCIREMIVALESGQEVGEQMGGDAPVWALKISPEVEEEIARKFSDHWALDRIQTSFLGLKLAILKRLNLFRSAINSLDTTLAIERIRSIEALDITIVLKSFADILEKLAGIRRWSFSFDEMEIAPKRVVALLYENMRGFDSRIVLKFSLYPYVDFYNKVDFRQSSHSGPVYGQDFEAVSLTNKFSNPITKFSKQLIAAECVKRGVLFHEFKKYMDTSGAISKGTRIFHDNRTDRDHDKIIELVITRNADRGLMEYYKHGELDDPNTTKNLSENQRASRIRKIAPLAEFRSYYFSSIERTNGLQSRRSPVKSFGYYHGFDQLLVLAEGIPRVVLQHANELIDAMLAGEASRVAQNRAVRNSLDRYRALVATQVVQPDGVFGLFENALSLADVVGHSVSERLLSKTFIAHPALTFEFNDLPPFQKRLVEIGVSTGAFVPDTDEMHADKILFNVEGIRLRMSHRLAAFYPLPLITGGFRKISGSPTTKEHVKQADLLSWEQYDD